MGATHNGRYALIPPALSFRAINEPTNEGQLRQLIGQALGGLTRVTTMLTPDERLRVDAVGMGFLHAYHRESMQDMWQDLRSQRVRALILSTAMCQQANISNMARMVREFPRIPAVALLSQMDRSTARTVLSLGQCGIRTLIGVWAKPQLAGSTAKLGATYSGVFEAPKLRSLTLKRRSDVCPSSRAKGLRVPLSTFS